MAVHICIMNTINNAKEHTMIDQPATFTFITPDYDTTCYLPSGGHPDDAAVYLKDAFTAEQFLRKNERAKLTWGHEACFESDYRYTVELGLVKVESMVWSMDASKSRWVQVLLMTINDFITEYYDK